MHIFITVYSVGQVVFNIDKLFDEYQDSRVVFLVGFYKYHLIQNGQLLTSQSPPPDYLQVMADRALGLFSDFLVFYLLNHIYLQILEMRVHKVYNPKEFKFDEVVEDIQQLLNKSDIMDQDVSVSHDNIQEAVEKEDLLLTGEKTESQPKDKRGQRLS